MTNKVLLRTIWDTGRLYREVSATQGENTVKGWQVIKARALSTENPDYVRVEFVDESRNLEGTFLTPVVFVTDERTLRYEVMIAYDRNVHNCDLALLDAMYNNEI